MVFEANLKNKLDTTIKRLVLIGFRGTGKSTLAKMLADKTGWPLVSTDALVVSQFGMEIPDIVQKFGWTGFREAEKNVIREISERFEVIVDCGGGVIEDSENIKRLRPRSRIVWVDAPLAIILKRLNEDQNRPNLTESDWESDISTNYLRRKPLYRENSDIRIDTSLLGRDRCVELIMKEVM